MGRLRIGRRSAEDLAIDTATGIGRYAWRYVTGAHMDGRARTDAGWLMHRGTRPVQATDRVTWWTGLPRLRRAGVRLGATAGTGGVLYGLTVAPDVTVATMGGIAALGVGRTAWQGWRAWQIREHRRTYVVPMGAALGPFLGHGHQDSAADIEKWLSLPVDFFTSESRPVMRVDLVPSQMYDDKTKTAALRLIADKLGRSLSDLDYQWQGSGAAPQITIRLAPKPPAMVDFQALKPLLEKAPESAPVVGIAARGKIISSDFDADSPHVAASAGSGAGKSVWGRLLIAQGLRNGWQFAILDKKRVSQAWCKDHPGVTYCRTGEEMHDTILGLTAELKRRYDLIDSAPDPDSIDVGPRIVLFFEEQNIGMKELKKYWEAIREKGQPKRSPAIDGIDELLCAGRQAKMHVITIAQLFTVQAAGGDPTARENYSTRYLARATMNAWKMLAPECAPFPKINRKAGRWYIAADGAATEFQVGYITEDEAREWSAPGHVTVPAQWTAGAEQSRDTVTGPDVTADGDRLYSLAECARAGFVGENNAEWLRQRKRRSGANFPTGTQVGTATKYTESEIREWYEASVLLASLDDSGGDSE